ncbi:MAG: type II/IV secretion system protein, partial [Pseudomonadota bacterium]
MSAVLPPKSPGKAGPAKSPFSGPLDWRRLVEWLGTDGMVSADEVRRTTARLTQAESAQHPLVRLASVAMERLSDGKHLDIETLTQWLAGRAGLVYLRIDPLKVDVGKVSETMSAAYAERHKVLPVQVTPTEVVVATAEPFLLDWVEEVERQSRRSVRRVVANPQDIHRFTAEFFALAKSVRAAQKSGSGNSGASFEQLVELGKSNKQLDAN